MNQYLEQKLLTNAQLTEWMNLFHQQGFLVIPHVLTPETCRQLREDLDKGISVLDILPKSPK